MRVRFARWLAGTFIAVGLVLVVVAVVLLAGGSSEGGLPVLVGGLVSALIGGVYLGPLPYVVIDGSSRVARAAWSTVRTGIAWSPRFANDGSADP